MSNQLLPSPETPFIHFKIPGDYVQGVYRGSESFHKKPDPDGDFVMEGFIHSVEDTNGNLVQFFGKPSLDPELVKRLPGSTIRVTFIGRTIINGRSTNQWEVEDLK